jgi:hypothetical protein
VLIGHSDWQLGLLADPQIWRDQFLDVSLVFMIFHDSAGGRGKMILLERRFLVRR